MPVVGRPGLDCPVAIRAGSGTLATSAARESCGHFVFQWRMVLVSFSLRIMVFTESLYHALERDIGHESRPVGWGFGNIFCEFQFSSDLKLYCRSFDAKKLGA